MDIREAWSRRATLAAAAQSHRALFYPAIRVLWQVLDDVRPLVNIYVALEDVGRIAPRRSQHTEGLEEEPIIVGLLQFIVYRDSLQ